MDMDGTLCDVSDIRHYVRGESRNFDKFHRASLFCPPNTGVLFACLSWKVLAKTPVLIVTARDARYEQVTRDWLFKYGVIYDALYMRPWGDQRPDYVVKSEILAQIRADGYNPVLAYDDNPSVIQLWEENNIKTVTVPGWID